MKKLLLATALTVSGVAIACEMRTIPFSGPITVSFLDFAIAVVQGHPNAGRAALLKNIDTAGEDVVGAAAWHANNYVGVVPYVLAVNAQNPVPGGSTYPIDKPCGQKMIDQAPTPASTYQGSGGGGGGYYWNGGRVYGSGGTCLYGCVGRVKVGDLEEA